MAVFARSAERLLRPARRGLPWGTLLAPVLMVGLAIGFAITADEAFAGRSLPGLTIGGVGVGSLEAAAIRERLEGGLAEPWASAVVTLRDGARVWRATNADLGIAPDLEAAVTSALSYGRTGRTLDRSGAWIDALRGEAKVPFALRARGDALERWLAAVALEADRAPVSGVLRVGPGGLEVTHPERGSQVDRVATLAALLSADSFGDREVALRLRATYPAVDVDGFDEAYARAAAATTPLTLRVEDRTWSESRAGLATLLVIDRVTAKPGELPAIPSDAIAPAVRYRYVVSLANERVGALVAAVSSALDHQARSARYLVSAEGEVTVVPSESGVRVDRSKLRALLLDELLRPTGATREIAAPVAALDPPIFATEKAKALAPLLSRTSTFTTYYPPSYARHANISTGSSQFDGLVILPGQTFSFWELIGPVTVERGYRYAGAIIDGRSNEYVIGGGLCQVSTTIFNAIAPEGYEIVERHAHGYYIDRYPVALDAAVFALDVDFKWRNDTANPLFIWSWNAEQSLTIDVWSIPTGRTVAFSDPVEWNFVLPEATQPADPAFPPGASVAGRDAWVTRTVSENGKVLHRDRFFSRYAPVWGGPAPDAEKPPQPSEKPPQPSDKTPNP